MSDASSDENRVSSEPATSLQLGDLPKYLTFTVAVQETRPSIMLLQALHQLSTLYPFSDIPPAERGAIADTLKFLMENPQS